MLSTSLTHTHARHGTFFAAFSVYRQRVLPRDTGIVTEVDMIPADFDKFDLYFAVPQWHLGPVVAS
jgi:hypothetical protein